jgi:hypothetical protein
MNRISITNKQPAAVCRLFPLEEEMDKLAQPTPKTPRRRIRKDRSEWVIQFAPPPVEGQQRLVFIDEPEQKEADDE